jgi:hypothetical protein
VIPEYRQMDDDLVVFCLREVKKKTKNNPVEIPRSKSESKFVAEE